MHEPGSEYWLQLFFFPGDVTITELDTTKDIAYTVVKLKYTVHEKINRQQYPCDPEATMLSFTKCAFKELEEFGKPNNLSSTEIFYTEVLICTSF